MNYTNTFAHVAKLVTVKLLLALAFVNGWYQHKFDVNNAFLHSGLFEEVYMAIPQGYDHKRESLPTNLVCRLHRSLYGLK